MWSADWTSESDGPHQVPVGGPSPQTEHIRLSDHPLVPGRSNLVTIGSLPTLISPWSLEEFFS